MSSDDAAATSAPASVPVSVLLRSGGTATIREVRTDDEGRLLEFLQGISDESLATRFFGAVSRYTLPNRAQALVGDSSGGTYGLVATMGLEQAIVGHAMFIEHGPGRAEVAFIVSDTLAGHGLASILLGRLAQAASARGIHTFDAKCLARNHAMIRVFEDSGFSPNVRPAGSEVEVEFNTTVGESTLARFDEREWVAAVNAVRSFLQPSSVAVIGASRQRGTIGGEVLHNLLTFGFEGPVLPVNSRSAVVQSVVAYPSVEDVPGGVDLAVIVVPAAVVLEVAEGCARKGVRGLVVISAGFAETGPEGRARQAKLLEICRTTGMRLIGPNCMGIMNTNAKVRLNATFAPAPPPAGRVAFMSQSGALGLAVMDFAEKLDLGLSSFVSVGNKADISGNDLIRYWEQDEDTDVILLYLESFGNPTKFARIAQRVGRKKPIIAVKSGRSPAGARATGSHTGALLAASDVTVEALFRQAGVIRTDTLEQMFDVASVLVSQPAPRGKRVGILTNAGGPGILCADTCEAEGLEVPALSEETRAALKELLATEASLSNPVDMIASASAEQYEEAIRIMGRDPNIDSLIVIFIPPLVTRAEDVARAVVRGVESIAGEKPVLSVFMQARGIPEELRSQSVRIPSLAFPENAAMALARLAQYGEWVQRPVEQPLAFADIRREEAASIVAGGVESGGWLAPDQVTALLACYGLPVLEQAVVGSSAEAASAAERLGGRLAVKAIAEGLVHKTEAGAVRLGLKPGEVAAVAAEMAERLGRLGTPPTGFLVQRMAEEGIEMIVGVVHDAQFGPVIAVGAGGVMVELLKDVSVRLAPITRGEAKAMIDEIHTRPLLDGYRGSPPRDVPALVEIVTRTSALVSDFPEIQELDLNPVLVHTAGATVVDARIRVGKAAPSRSLGEVG